MVNVSVGLLQIITVVWVFHHFHPLKAFGYQSVDNPYSLTKYFGTNVSQASVFVGCFLGFGRQSLPEEDNDVIMAFLWKVLQERI